MSGVPILALLEFLLYDGGMRDVTIKKHSPFSYLSGKASVILVWLTILLLPLPFLGNLLIGEEGMFAYLAVDNGRTNLRETQDRDMLLIGRIDSKDLWEAPRHPIIPYLVIAKVFRSFSCVPDFENASIKSKSRQARMPFYFLYILAWILLLSVNLWILKAQTFRSLVFPLGLILFIGSGRLMVGGAVQTFYDGSFGLLLTAGCAMVLCLVANMNGIWNRALLFFGAGFIAAMGKNEWALALMGAVITSMAIHFLYRMFYKKEDDDSTVKNYFWRFSFLTLAGVVVGSMVHYWLEPFNYFNGFKVMLNFGLKSPSDWSSTFKERLPFLLPFVIIIAIAVFLAVKHLRRLMNRQISHMFLLFWGLFLFGGFILTAHRGDGFPRWFCPAMFALTAFILAQSEHWIGKTRLPVLIASSVLGLLVLVNCFYLYESSRDRVSIGAVPGRSLIKQELMYLRYNKRFHRTGRVETMDAAVGYYFPGLDFKNNT